MGDVADYQIEQMFIPWDGFGYSPADELCLSCDNHSDDDDFPWCKVGYKIENSDDSFCPKFIDQGGES
jgi:hypothetical protein